MMRIYCLLVALSFSLVSISQSVEEGRKLLKYGRLQSAQDMFEKLVAANPTDPEATYWLGQIYINDVPAKVKEAKEIYSKALTANKNPLLLVGMGHVNLMEKKDAEAKQLFEQAIEETKSRRQRNGDPAILAAIGRANASGDAKTGDVEYGLEKLKLAAEADKTDPDIMVDMGRIHLKRGGEYGGQAKRAFEEASERDPNYGLPLYRIGKIFESQRNTELFLDYYNRSVNVDPKFAPAYLALYDYYKSKDVNKAKDYLDKFMANNDPDRETDFFYADFLFRSGKNEESLKKGQEIEAGLKPNEKFPKVYALYAMNYDRLGDSVKARDNMEKYINMQDPSNLTGDDYAEMARLYLKFPGLENKADALVEKAVSLDTSRDNQIKYMQALANAYAAQNNYAGNFKWLNRIDAINPNKTAVTYYYLADAAFKAGEFKASEDVSGKYINAYPDQPQGYLLKRRAAISIDPDTSSGSALPTIEQHIAYLQKDVAGNKGRLLENYGYKIYYYLIKSREYDKALQACKDILAFDPENDYAIRAQAEAERLIKATSGDSAANKETTKNK